MAYATVTIGISDFVMKDKSDVDYDLIWKTLHPVTVTMAQLKQAINDGHPFTCSRKKDKWDGQSLFGIDIDNFNAARGIYSFDQFIAILDALGLPPCITYTTFHNPDRKKERFRLLFRLSEPVTDLDMAWKISRHLFSIIDELIPGAPDKNCKRPYGLFYPGKKIILYRPKLTARLDIISEVIREKEKPHVIIDTAKVLTKIKKILSKDPFIPSVTIKNLPPRLLLILGPEPGIFSIPSDIKTSLGILHLGLLNTNRLLYNLLLHRKIIDIYINIQYAVEQSKKIPEKPSISVFQHYCSMFSGLMIHYSYLFHCDYDTAKTMFKVWEKQIYQAMDIQINPDQYMVLPSRYIQYAKAVMNFTKYPNLNRLFQRDNRKRQVLATTILLARELHLQLKDPTETVPQYIITQQMIADKLAKKFGILINRNTLASWLKQFHDLQLIHICSEEEIAAEIKKQRRSPLKKPTVLQIPYFDESVLIHAEILASQYKPAIKMPAAENMQYQTIKAIASILLDNHGCFSRDAFIRFVLKESALDNTDGFTVENAQTYFDKYMPQIQQELHLIKSSCTKELMTRFPGNHKIGLTKLYYRGD